MFISFILACTMSALHLNPWVQALTSYQVKASTTSDTLKIGSVTLRLGMPEDAVLTDLRAYYSLKRIEPSTESFENWFIQDKNRPEQNLGTLRFRSRKLTLASKEWTSEAKEYSGTDVAQIIYKLALEFERNGDVSCTIRTLSSVQAAGPGGMEFRETEFKCGHRHMIITLGWQSGQAWVQVRESIADEIETFS